MKKAICLLSSVFISLTLAGAVMGAEVNLDEITGQYSDAVVEQGIAGATVSQYYGTENPNAVIENVEVLGDNCIIITLDSYFPDFNISDLKLQAYTSDWYSLKAKLQDKITYSDYNISVNKEGKTVITIKIDQNLNNNRLESVYNDQQEYSDSEKESILTKADNEISWQLDCGGWDKDYDTHVKRQWNGTEDKITKGWKNASGEALGTIDNSATYSEMYDIALAYALSGEAKYKTSFTKGLNFIKKLQYESGGFAQVYPRRGNYSDYVTFNDDAMISVLMMLEKIEDKRYPYNTDIISDSDYTQICTMIDKATDFILKAQLTVAGERSAWCAQHDPVTYEPLGARAYELPSVSGSESIGVIKFLLNQQDNPQAIQAAEAAIKWFENHKVENTAFDKNATEDLNGDGIIDYFYYKEGNTIWYRFYDLTTAEGFFSDYDGVKYWDISQISENRRTGYAWSGNWPSKIINPYNQYGYFPDKIVVSVAKTKSVDINGKTLLSGNTASPVNDNLASSLPVNSEKTYLYGDADGDGILTATDSAVILQKVLNNSYILPLEEKTADYVKYIDVNCSGEIEATDSAIVLQKVLVNTFKMPVEQ